MFKGENKTDKVVDVNVDSKTKYYFCVTMNT